MILRNRQRGQGLSHSPSRLYYVISKEIEGRRAKTSPVKVALILIFLALTGIGCVYSVIAGGASAHQGTALEPMGNGAGSGTEIVDTGIGITPDERKRICSMDSVTCGKVTTMTISAYTSEIRQTDASPEIGATGENIYKLLQKGIRTCASNDYRFGTKLIIPGIGECVIKDRMNKRYTGQGVVDVYLGYDTARAWKWGRKQLQVEVVE